MDGFEQFSDMMGDFVEGISDVVTDVSETVVDFSKETLEHFDETGIKELHEGDLEGALKNSDFPDKEGMKDVANIFHLDKKVIAAGTKVIGGALGTIAALATPGLQIAAGVAAGSLVTGIGDFKAVWDDQKQAQNAAMMRGYSGTA